MFYKISFVAVTIAIAATGCHLSSSAHMKTSEQAISLEEPTFDDSQEVLFRCVATEVNNNFFEESLTAHSENDENSNVEATRDRRTNKITVSIGMSHYDESDHWIYQIPNLLGTSIDIRSMNKDSEGQPIEIITLEVEPTRSLIRGYRNGVIVGVVAKLKCD